MVPIENYYFKKLYLTCQIQPLILFEDFYPIGRKMPVCQSNLFIKKNVLINVLIRKIYGS